MGNSLKKEQTQNSAASAQSHSAKASNSSLASSGRTKNSSKEMESAEGSGTGTGAGTGLKSPTALTLLGKQRRFKKKFKSEEDESPQAGMLTVTPSYSNSKMTMFCMKEVSAEELMEAIPLEILSHCLSFLSVKETIAASQVCKKFLRASMDSLLWKSYCRRDFNIDHRWNELTWREAYRRVAGIQWDEENSVPNEFKFSDSGKSITKITSYGVATARSKRSFGGKGEKYVYEIKVNYRRANFFYGVGLIDKGINFNFCKATYPKIETQADYDRRFENQWFYWSDGNCWDILGSHPVSNKTRTYLAKKGIERDMGTPPSLSFFTGDTIGIILDYTTPQPLLTFTLNGKAAHQFVLPESIELYLAVYFYNANDSVTITHCPQDKYDMEVKSIQSTIPPL